MPVPRRDFMKLFGVSLGSLLLARCQRKPKSANTPDYVTCYEIVVTIDEPATATPSPESVGPRDKLRLCWLRFGELADKTADGANDGENGENPLGREMIADHHAALRELAASGEITLPVGDLIQEAYEAAVNHIWWSNAGVVCYDMVYPDYAPAGAENLVQQTITLQQIAAEGSIDPGTMEKVRRALEHDLAFYALTDSDVQALYEKLAGEYAEPGDPPPTFEELELALTPDVKAAAKFIVDLLTGKE
jgi:hypothetical protein